MRGLKVGLSKISWGNSPRELKWSTLRKKSPYSELLWSVFLPDFPRSISPYLVRKRENPRKMRTRITPNTDSFYAVSLLIKNIAAAENEKPRNLKITV